MEIFSGLLFFTPRKKGDWLLCKGLETLNHQVCCQLYIPFIGLKTLRPRWLGPLSWNSSIRRTTTDCKSKRSILLTFTDCMLRLQDSTWIKRDMVLPIWMVNNQDEIKRMSICWDLGLCFCATKFAVVAIWYISWNSLLYYKADSCRPRENIEVSANNNTKWVNGFVSLKVYGSKYYLSEILMRYSEF